MNNREKILHQDKAVLFRALHAGEGLLVMPNAWDAGSAKILTSLGFQAIATTSAGLAFSLGKPDGQGAVTREECLHNAEIIINATHLPVSADLENCYADDPETCAETIRMAASKGIVGGSIEDATGDPADPIYPLELSVERVKAAVLASANLDFSFTLTARAENLIYGRDDLKDTIHRLQLYADAGANVLFAPGLKTVEQIKTVVNAIAPKPLSILLNLNDNSFTIDELRDLGVKRVSLGSGLSRVAYGALFHLSKQILEHHQYAEFSSTVSYASLNQLFTEYPFREP